MRMRRESSSHTLTACMRQSCSFLRAREKVGKKKCSFCGVCGMDCMCGDGVCFFCGCVVLVCVVVWGWKRDKKRKREKMRSERAKSGLKEAEAQKIRLR